MASIWYINLETQQVTSVEPDLSGKQLLTLNIADGESLGTAMNQLTSLKQMLQTPIPTYATIVIKIVIGT